jgi:hypothetical protein
MWFQLFVLFLILPIDSAIGRRIGTQNRQAALIFDFTGNVNRFKIKIDNLPVHGLAFGGNKQHIDGPTIFLSRE